MAQEVRRRVERGGERLWSVADMRDLPAVAATKSLARLGREGELTRMKKGLYYRPRQTALGPSAPSADQIIAKTTTEPLHPARRSAAHTLGFSSQVPARAAYATSAMQIPAVLLGKAHVLTRRPKSRRRLTRDEGALLEFLRDRGRYSDFEPEATVRRLVGLAARGGTFAHLVSVSHDEPPRVRAMLGAIGEQIGARPIQIYKLRRSVNPLSRFDFGALAGLDHAESWQAK